MVFGYDIDTTRISDLRQGIDKTLELEPGKLKKVLLQNPDSKTGLYFTDKLADISSCTYYIVTVPTPVDEPINLFSHICSKVVKR